MEWGETIKQACRREMQEEANANFNFKKIIYIRDYIKPDMDEHSIELYILGDIDKFKEVEGLRDKEFDGDHWQTWVDLDKLQNIDVRPKNLVKQIIKDHKKGFKIGVIYLGEID